ncbi:transmembrane family of transporters domain-containing protein [Ditylenchus destructor]|nr:transmembrane family of transporters domain-containing protein [Ditylenchus destructor]
MDTVLGLGACAVTTFCLSFMYVPVRKYNTGDGVFVHWILSLGIFVSGMLMNGAMAFPQIQPLAMLGGCCFAMANLVAMPIFKVIGLGMGNLLWGFVNCLVGWATAQFGLFGLKKHDKNNPWLNYPGVILVLLGGALFAFVKPSTHEPEDSSRKVHPKRGSLNYDEDEIPKFNGYRIEEGETKPPSSLDAGMKARIIAVVASLLCGLSYGVQFVPAIYIQENPGKFKNAEADTVYYAFSHFSGVFLTANLNFLVYAVYKGNKPVVNPEVILPAFMGGVIWAIGQLAWFFANDLLSQAISFPLNTMMPGVCCALWSVFYFKEITGRKNLMLLWLAIGITCLGAVLVGMSKAFV